MRHATAWWVVEPGRSELRDVALPEPRDGEVLVRALFSGVSRGTEELVFDGRVPESLRDVMRAPFQVGDFPGPVEYGYQSVGVVESGPADLVGRRVFCLHPHQDAYVVPADAVLPLPDGVPSRRAVLAGNLETAVNALWDAAPRVGDRACVVGAGTVGCCVARLLAQIPGADVTLVDVDPARAEVAGALGVRFRHPDEIAGAHEIVVHASHTADGLRRCLDLLAPDNDVLELSWYGDRQVSLPLGEAFHSRRLGIRASQVGTVSSSRRATRTRRERLAIALRLLADPAYDALLDGSSPFDELPHRMPAVLHGHGLCHVVEYPNSSER